MKISTGKLLLMVGATLCLSGCASIGPPEAPSLELPKPPTDLHAARKGNKVTLTWTIPQRTTERQSVRYLGKSEICRGIAQSLKQCGKPVGEVKPPADFEKTRKSSGKKLTATFIDTLPSAIEPPPAEFASYAVEVLNTAGRGAGLSNQLRVALVPTLPPFGDFAARITAAGVLISWRCPETAEGRRGSKYLFRIYRRLESRSNWIKVEDVDATQCAEGASGQEKLPSFLDQSFEWEKTYVYKGTVVSMIEVAGNPAVEVEGDDSPEVTVFAHDVFPPAVPSGLQAVFSGPGQQPFIDLVWAPVSDADLEGYNVYRHEDGGERECAVSQLFASQLFAASCSQR
jgi:hypothetical protein